MSSRWRTGLLLAALGMASVALALQLGKTGGLKLPLFDFVQYWAAGRLNAHGENPYDPAAIHRLEEEAGRTSPGVLMWNPPWTLPLVMPFGLLDVHTAHLLWLLTQFAALLISVGLLWRYYGGGRLWVAWLVAFTFAPLVFALTAGQISPLLLLGVVLFLQMQRGGHDFLAGAATLLIAIKPHLSYLFWLALLLWVIGNRRWWVLAGGLTAGVTFTLLAVLPNPEVLSEYWRTLSTQPPSEYRSPTLGTVLRQLTGSESFRLQFLAMVPGLVWFVPYWMRHRREWDWGERMTLLLLVSMLTAAYGAWPFDLVLLLVPVISVAAALEREGSARGAALGFHVAVNGLALALMLGSVEFFWFLWMTPALLLGYLVFRPATSV